MDADPLAAILGEKVTYLFYFILFKGFCWTKCLENCVVDDQRDCHRWMNVQYNFVRVP